MYSINDKRIIKEIKDIVNNYNNISIIKTPDSLVLKVNVKFKIIKVIINKSYPFKSPEIFINNKNYHSVLCIKDNYVLKNIRERYKIDCLCCKSIICPALWNPSKNILNILDEVRINGEILRKLYLEKIIYMLCKSYGIYCLEIPDFICKFL